MSKSRWAAKVDANQPGIVKALRKIPGVMVEVGMDDILVGYKYRTFWYEIKASEKAAIKPHQKELREMWPGHYKIVWTLEMILDDMGIN
tara:strand:- start:1801 stop:2067 length:267 start_codon:yes stop_codon:yes gene_type:complete